MQNYTLGFIGGGNMANAILSGMSAEMRKNTFVYDVDTAKLEMLCEVMGTIAADSPGQLVAECDAVLLAVKPNAAKAVLEGIGTALKDKLLLTIVAGLTSEQVKVCAPGCRVIRIMPNTPCMVGEGMSVLEQDSDAAAGELEFALKLFSSIGRVEQLPGTLFDAVTGLSGSAPAYVYLFMEALADGGVLNGIPRDKAYTLAAQTVLGAAKMMLNNPRPGELKDAVCSPGGTTIEGVYALEQSGLRSAVISAVDAATAKSRELSGANKGKES